MSDPDTILKAIRNADAAGDAEGAKRLTAMYHESNYQTPVTTIDVPASTSPQSDGVPAYKPSSVGEDLANGGKFVLGSAGRGLGSALVAAGRVMRLEDPFEILPLFGGNDSPVNQEQLRQEDKIRNFIPNLIGADRPTTDIGRIADATIQAASNPIGGLRSLAQHGLQAFSGFVGQIASELAPDKYKDITAILASFGAAHAAGAAKALLPKPVHKLLEGAITTPEQEQAVRDAGAAARNARANGFSSNTLDHLSGPKGKLGAIESALVGETSAPKTIANIQAQPEQLQAMGNAAVDGIGGRTLTEQTNANNVREAATGVVTDAKRAATSNYAGQLNDSRTATNDQLAANAGATGRDLTAAINDQNVAHIATDEMLRQSRNDQAAEQRRNNATAADTNRLNLGNAAKEVATPPVFNLNELGNTGTQIAVKRLNTGQPAQHQFTPSELVAAGVPQDHVDALVASKQPLTQNTGAMSDSAVPVTAQPGAVGRAATKINSSVDQDAASAQQAHDSALDAIKGVDVLSPEGKAEASQKITDMMRDQVGNTSLMTDLAHMRDGVENLQTSGQLHNFIVSLKQNLPSIRLNTKPADLSENGVLSPAINTLKNLRNDTTDGYAQADAGYKADQQGLRNLKSGTDLQKLTGPQGSYSDAAAAKTSSFKLLADGENPKADPSDQRLKGTLTAIGQKDPVALQEMVKSYLSDVMGKVFSKQGSGRPNPNAGADLSKQLGDASKPENDYQKNGLDIALDAVASTSKLSVSDASAMRRGVDYLREMANAHARTPKDPSLMSQGELKELAGNPAGIAAGRLLGINVGNAAVRLLMPFLQKRTFAKLDTLFSDPSVSTVEQLITLGKGAKPNTRMTRNLAGVAGYFAANSVNSNNVPE